METGWIWSEEHRRYYRVTEDANQELVYTWAPLPNELTYTAPENVFSSTTTVIKGQGNVASLRESHEKSEGRYRSRIQAEANRFFSAGRVFAMLWSDPTYGKSQESPTHGYNVTYAIPGQIRDRDQLERSSDALADYCAKHNFLSGKYATELGLSTNLHEATTITIGSGKKIKTLGTATTQFSFRGEQKVYDLIFHVLPNCVRDVVLGKPFLRATRTLQDARKFASRIVKKTGSMLMRHEFYFLGDSAPTFTGSINGIHSKALADCGSSVLVMDQDHALSLGLHVDRSSQTRLLFADGSSKYTTGVTRGVRWQFGPELDAEEHYLDFHILENAPAPVVLSDTFLFDTQAYSKYDCYLLDDGDEALLDEDDDGFFCHITVDDTYDPQEHINMSSSSNRRHAETCLRSQNRAMIARLPQAEQDVARQTEKERQETWQRETDALEQAHIAAVQQTANTPSTDTTTTTTLQPPRPPAKRSSFWLKFKRQKGQKPPAR